MATQTEIINIVVREDGSRVVRRNVEDIGGAADKAGTAVNKLKGIIAAAAGGVVINQLRQLADAYTNIQNRLRLTTNDQGNLNAVFNEIQAISTRTRSALEANVELYSRMSISAKDLGLSQKEVLEFTESLNQAIKISGATATEAEAGIRQLSQGLASGALRGDELNSVLENLPAVADIIAQSLGVTRGELRKMGAEGKITADTIVTAFQGAREEIAEKFAKTAPTAAEGFVLLKNQLIETVGAIDQAAGASSALGGILVGAVELLKELTPEFVSFARAITGTLDPMDEMSDAGKALASIFITVYGVLKSVADVLYGVVLTAFKTVGKVIAGVVAAQLAVLSGEFTQAFEIVKEAGRDIGATFVDESNKAFGNAIDDTSAMFDKLAQVWDKGSRTIQDRSKNAVGTVSTESGPGRGAPGLSEAELEKQRKALEKLQNALRGVLNDIDPLAGAQLELAKDQSILEESYRKGLITLEQYQSYLLRLDDHYNEILDPLSKLNKEIDQQIALLGLSNREREIEAQVLAATQDLKSRGAFLTEAETIALREKFKALQEVNNMVQIQDQLLANSVEQRQAFLDQLQAIQNLLNDPNSGFGKTDATQALMQQNPELFEGTQEAIEAQLAQFQYMYEQIDLMRQKNLISEQTAAQMIAKVQAQQFEYRLRDTQSFFGNLATLAKSENTKIAKIGQAAALAAATIDAASAIMKTYASTPYPYNIALAAAQAVASAAQIARIASAPTSFQTGGSFTVGGSGGTDSQMVAFRATPGEKVSISNQNQLRKGDPNQGAASGQPVQIAGPTIINVRDPKEIPNAIQSSDGKDAIINVVSENAAIFREILRSN